VWFLVFLFAWPWRRMAWGYGPRPWAHDPALDVIRTRYARGEIAKEQFDLMVRNLTQHP